MSSLAADGLFDPRSHAVRLVGTDRYGTAVAIVSDLTGSDVQVVGIAVSSGCSGPCGMSRRSSPVRSARTTTRAT